MSSVYFATSNRNKLKEVQEVIGSEIHIKHLPFEHNEIRSDSIEEIAKDAVEHAYSIVYSSQKEFFHEPVFVEDTGLFIDSLNGFPGTYSKWVLEKIGIQGILELLEKKERGAEFRCCIAYKEGKEIQTFLGTCAGSISEMAKGKSGFGYDPIFIPKGYTETFAQSIGLKNNLSHRYRAITKLKEFLLTK